MVSALKALHAAGALAAMNLMVVMTGDEEDSGRPLSLAREALVSAAKGAQIAIGFENGPGDPKLGVTARRGTTGWQVTRDRRAGALVADLSRGHRIRRGLRSGAHHRQLPRTAGGAGAPDLQPRRPARRYGGRVRPGADARHRVRKVERRRRARGRLRRSSRPLGRAFRTAREAMEEVVAASLPHTHATITFDEGYPAMAPTEGNARLLAMYDQVSRDLGFGAVTAVSPDRAGAADVSFVAAKNQHDHRRGWSDGEKRSYGRGNRRPRHAPFPDEAHGRAALPHSAGGRGEVIMSCRDSGLGTRDSGLGLGIRARGSLRLETGDWCVASRWQSCSFRL